MAVVHTKPIPNPSPLTSLRALRAILRDRSVLAGMQVFHAETGDVFRLSLPGFNPVVLVGAEATHFILTKARHDLRWRIDDDPITKLLIHGVLVEDGDSHDQIRRSLNPALHRNMLSKYEDAMLRRTDQIIDAWTDTQPVDMLVEMRKAALLILMDALFHVDYTPEMERLWHSVLNLIGFISPGLWLVWKNAPRPGYRQARALMDEYLLRIIRLHREHLDDPDDMISFLIKAGMSDELIRDQLMTMLIAGHDTSTAMLAWSLYLLGAHPEAQARAREEIDQELNGAAPNAVNTLQLRYLQQIIDETLRLYPPIHLGSRVAAVDLEFDGFAIPKETRVLYSIFLTHRHPDYWERPNDFDPDHFSPENKHKREHYMFLPFGGGPRNCIGMAFAQVETRIVLARILQRFRLEQRGHAVHLHMGATLEPRPGVWIQPYSRLSKGNTYG